MRDLAREADGERFELWIRMKIWDKIKSLFRSRPPTEEEIARAQADMILRERIRDDSEAGPYI
jgi:hypothetical protein